MCECGDDGRLFTLSNIPAVAGCWNCQSGQAVLTAHPSAGKTLQHSWARRRVVSAFYSLRPLWSQPHKTSYCLLASPNSMVTE
jgi:hypothetical protein